MVRMHALSGGSKAAGSCLSRLRNTWPMYDTLVGSLSRMLAVLVMVYGKV